MKLFIVTISYLLVLTSTKVLDHQFQQQRFDFTDNDQTFLNRVNPKFPIYSKRSTTVEGHTDHDKSGTNVGGSITHNSGSSSVGAHVDHSSNGGTSYGVHGSHSWSHSDGSKTSVSGGISHGSHGGTSGGVSISHSFGKRLADLEAVVRDLQTRQTTVHGHANKDQSGTHVGGGVEHTSKDGNTHTEGHVEHNSNGGTSYGGSFSHTFGNGKRSLTQRHVEKRQTTIGGYGNKDQYGSHIGGSISHTSGSNTFGGHIDYSKPGGTSYGGSASHEFSNGGSISGNVDHNSAGTSYGVSGGKTWSHSDGSHTSLTGGATHDSFGGNNVGLQLTHSFGRRLVKLESDVGDILKRQTTVHGHADKDQSGTHVGGGVEHTSKDGNTHTEGHVEHNSNGGTSYGGSFSHTFGNGKRSLTQRHVEKRQTTIGGYGNKDQYGSHIGGSISHTSGSNTFGGHIDYSKPGGTSYGGSASHEFSNGGSISGNVDHNSAGASYGVSGGKTWSHSDGSHTSLTGGATHDSFGGNNVGLQLTHSFGRRLVKLESDVGDILKRQTTVHGHADKDQSGTHVGGGVEHTSKDGNTHTEGHVEHNSNGGTSYGGSFSHTFGNGKRSLTQRHVEKRQTTIGGYGNKDQYGSHIGGSISHTSGSNTFGGHIDYSKPGGTSYGGSASHEFSNGGSISGNVDHNLAGTSYGVSGGKTWSHSDGSHTSLTGGATHDSSGGNNVGLQLTHSFGRRLVKLESNVGDILKRQTTVHGHADKDQYGTHVGGGVEHTSKDGNTHTEGHVEHNSNGGTSYGGSFSHTFGKRLIIGL